MLVVSILAFLAGVIVSFLVGRYRERKRQARLFVRRIQIIGKFGKGRSE